MDPAEVLAAEIVTFGHPCAVEQGAERDAFEGSGRAMMAAWRRNRLARKRAKELRRERQRVHAGNLEDGVD
jgi:hypothetical protein